MSFKVVPNPRSRFYEGGHTFLELVTLPAARVGYLLTYLLFYLNFQDNLANFSGVWPLGRTQKSVQLHYSVFPIAKYLGPEFMRAATLFESNTCVFIAGTIDICGMRLATK